MWWSPVVCSGSEPGGTLAGCLCLRMVMARHWRPSRLRHAAPPIASSPSWSASWWLSMAARMNISVSVLKMSAWTKVSMISRPYSATGRQQAGREPSARRQRDLATVDVAEESHRQRQRLDELEQQLHEAHEEGDEARADAVLNS